MLRPALLKIYAIAIFATIILLLTYIYLNHYCNGNLWSLMTPSKSALTAEYCELDNTTHFFRQTMNSYSNLFYFFLGMIVILVSLYDKKDTEISNKNMLQQFSKLSALFGCCLVYLCFGSTFFHASLTWVGQRADMNATYSVCITLIGISSYRLLVKDYASEHLKKTLIRIILILILAFVELHLIIPGTILLPLMIGILVTLTTINYLQNKEQFNIQLAFLSLLLMVAAFTLRTIDVMKITCDPVSLYQGHAVWHLFTGMGAFILYWFYRSEKV